MHQQKNVSYYYSNLFFYLNILLILFDLLIKNVFGARLERRGKKDKLKNNPFK